MLTACTVGCSRTDDWPPIYPAGGKVTYTDGAPFVTGGQIEFELIEKVSNTRLPSARAQIQPDGTFRLGTRAHDDGAFLGEHRVVVAAAYGSPEFGRVAPPIAHKYLSYDTSGLKFLVTKDAAQNQFHIQVEHFRR